MKFDKITDIINECVDTLIKEKLINERRENSQHYTHLAVNKKTGLIVNGWDYSDVDPSELKQFKRDYFMEDLKDYGFNPKAFKIVTTKYAEKTGINQWSSTGVFPLEEENKMQQEGQNPFELAREKQPDAFID